MKKNTLLVLLFTFLAGGDSLIGGEAFTLIPYNYKPGEITKLCDETIQNFKSALDQLVTLPPEQINFTNTVEEQSHLLGEFRDKMNALEFMGYVPTDEALRKEGFACEEKSSQFMVEVSLRKDLYNAFQQFRKNRKDDFSALPPSQQRLIELTIRDHRESGVWLEEDKLSQLRTLKTELSSLETRHSQNLVEDKSFIIVSEEELSGISETFKNRLKKDENGRYIVSARGADFFQFMETADSEEARRQLFFVYANRAVPENTQFLKQALVLRSRIKNLLGFKTWSDYRANNRMAKDADTIKNFLNALRQKLVQKNREEIAALFALKKQDHPKATALHQYDRMYYSNKLKKRDYAVDEDIVRQYFPSHRVIEGTFKIYSRLLGLEFKKVDNADVWHQDVELFEIRDKLSQTLLGYFYADLYPREGKYSHAAAFTLRNGRILRNGQYQKTISAIVANLNPPSADTPSLMSHADVETFFHEFGHIMHQTITRAVYGDFSGTSVARDFVEAPSQMFENWVWNKEMLEILSGHYQDESKKLPDELLKNLLRLSQFNNGMNYTRQIYYAMLDQTLHTSDEDRDVVKVADDLCAEITGIPNPEGTQWIAGFGHLMGGYDAGYYGYLWSEVYAQDMFTKFEKNGLLNEEWGMRYRTMILEQGSSKDEMELIKTFLGREPNEEAFYRKIGIEEKKPTSR